LSTFFVLVVAKIIVEPDTWRDARGRGGREFSFFLSKHRSIETSSEWPAIANPSEFQMLAQSLLQVCFTPIDDCSRIIGMADSIAKVSLDYPFPSPSRIAVANGELDF